MRRSDLANDKEVDETFITSSRETRNFSGIDIPKILEATNPDIIYKARSVIKNERMKMEMRSQNSEQQIKNENGGRSYSAHSRLYDISQSLPVADEKEQRQQKQEFTAQTLRRRTTETCEGVRKIVTCKKDTSEETCKKNLLAAGVVLVSDMPNTPFFAVCIDAEERALVLAGLSDVASVEDDPLRTLSYIPTSEVVKPMQTSEQVIPYGVELVKAPEFWDMYGKRGEGMKVCVIDSGLRTTHEDLIAGDLSGSSDSSVVTPWDGFSGSHGTHVTGTIAAQDNTVGVVGVAPDASIYVVRIFSDSGSASASIFMQGLNACARAGVNIINMSLGGPGSSTAERNLLQSLKDSGILLVAAAGNTASTNNRVQYPAGYESVMSVGAIDENLEIAIFSSHNNQVDIVAPGVGVLSTTAARDTSYSQYDGTSMAAPHIAGVAALLWSQFPEKSVDEIQNALSQSAQDLGACGRDRLFGHGVVDVMAAAAYLENGGVAATELESCVDVTISLTTDDWGQDTFFFVVPEDNIENTIYRGGPYVNGRRATYTENIQLPDGCYFLLLLDRFGDG